MFIPLTSDASLKYWPIATVCFIVVHIVVLIIQTAMPARGFEIEDARDPNFGTVHVIDLEPKPGWYDYMLSHGNGLHPVQWLTSMLMHDGWGHLIGNMIFLWVFGHVVEGILGPFAFAGLYLGMGFIQNFVGQLLFLGFPAEPSLGASGAIYSIMVLAALWAPQDNIQCFLMIFLRFMIVSIPILIFALFYVLWDLGFALLQHFSLSTELLHLTGAATGFVVGLGLLSTGKIDCDERDLFSMIRDASGKPKKAQPKTVVPIQPPELTAEEIQEKMRKLAFAWKTFDAHLVSGHPDSAIAQLQIVRKVDKSIQWDEPRLIQLIQALQSHHRYDDVMKYSETYLHSFQSRAVAVRLNMARIQLVEKGLPGKALKILTAMDAASLDPKNRKVFDNLLLQCKKQISEGSIELQDD